GALGETAASTTDGATTGDDDVPAHPQSVLDRANLLSARANEETDAGRLDEAAASASELIALSEETGDPRFAVSGYHLRGRANMLNGQYAAAAKDAIESAHVARAIGNDRRELRAAGLAISALAGGGRYDEARHWSRTVDALLERVDDDGQLRAETLGSQAALLRNLGDPNAARGRYQQALAIADSDSSIDPYTVAATYSGLAATSMDVGDYQAAYDAYRRSSAGFRVLLGEEHPGTATATMNLGIAAHNLGDRSDEARELLLNARAIFERVLSPEADHAAFCDHTLGLLEQGENNLDKALEYLHRAREGFERAHGDEHLTLIRTNTGITNVLGQAGRYEEALRSAERARRIAESLFDHHHPALGYAVQAVGRAKLSLQREDAAATLKTAADILETAQAPPIEVGRAKFEVAQALDWRPGARRFAEAAAALTDGAEGDPGLHGEIVAWLQARPAARFR
ncbi:MAG: tetratricopeptide repeat protein, partial [Myxococcota bacterium]